MQCFTKSDFCLKILSYFALTAIFCGNRYRPHTAVNESMNAQAQRIAAMHSQKKPKNTQYRQNNSREERQQTQTVQAKKIIGVPNTVQHRSSKAQALMSPQPTRSQASQSEMKQMSENVRHMNTSKFLHTNLDGYLKEGERVGCIDCQNCVRIKDKVLQFKYNPSIKSSYGANFANSSAHKRQA